MPAAATPTLTGFSTVAGVIATQETPVRADAFKGVNPATGRHLEPAFHPATDEDIDRACREAWTAFALLEGFSAAQRAQLLDRAADGIRALGTLLIATVAAETGLHQARVEAERDRTVYTLRLFAERARRADWTDATIDTADPTRTPRPRPDLRRMLRPLGPVAVFGASNFPLAYSTAGGDTASALAAGCPVVVKGHPAHPATGELIARVLTEAVADVQLPPGTFSYLVAGGRREHAIGEALLAHPCIRAVGFTGSPEGGQALAALAAQRPDPIPVFAEMGSVNPHVLLPGALEARGDEIADEIAAAVLGSSGQMCTCPGLLFARRSPATERFIARLAERFAATPDLVMLSARVRTGYMRRIEQIAAIRGVDLRVGEAKSPPRPPLVGRFASAETADPEPLTASPALFVTDAQTFQTATTLHDEAFGPSTILVLAASDQALLEALSTVQGALAAAIYAEPVDTPMARPVQALLEQRAGRVVYNGPTTGVEVTHAIVQGGPFPATNQPHTSAVGPLAITRWTRPVAFQNAPDEHLPDALQDANPLQIPRLINGVRTTNPVKRPEA